MKKEQLRVQINQLRLENGLLKGDLKVTNDEVIRERDVSGALRLENETLRESLRVMKAKLLAKGNE